MVKKTAKADTPADGAKVEKKSSSRRVYLFGRLENEVVLPVISRLYKLSERDATKPIDLLINSSGGNGYNADAIIAVMHSIYAPVNTVCLGHALSGACEILASGTGTRSAYEFSTLMFHQTLWEADGDITNLEIQAKQGQKFRDAQIELLSRCTGQTSKRIRQDIERDHYLSAEEALEYGLIDNIIIHSAPDVRARRAVALGGFAAKAQAASAAAAKVRARTSAGTGAGAGAGASKAGSTRSSASKTGSGSTRRKATRTSRSTSRGVSGTAKY